MYLSSSLVNSSMLDGMGWLSLSVNSSSSSVVASGSRLADGAMFVTNETVYREHIDFEVKYSVQSQITRLAGGSIPSGGSIAVTYYALDTGVGSRWNRFLSNFTSHYISSSGKYIDAIAVWNEAVGEGLYFFGSHSNVDIYSLMLHDSSAAIRSSSSSKVLVVNGADEIR